MKITLTKKEFEGLKAILQINMVDYSNALAEKTKPLEAEDQKFFIYLKEISISILKKLKETDERP